MPNNQPITNYQLPMPRQEMPLGCTNHLSDDLLFLITCCQVDPSEDDIEFIHSILNDARSGNALGVQQLDTKALLGLATQHGILPLVYKTLKKLHIDIQEYFLKDLKSTYTQIAQRNMLMSAELIRIMKLLEKNNIEALAFKGPALSQMAYGDITLRQYSDLDILINEKEIAKAGSILEDHGYEADFPIKILENKTCLEVTNDLGFFNPSSGLLIELHWKLFREKIGRHLSFKQISENKQTIMINRKSLSTLSPEMLLAYLCLHGSKHAWERIEWICDIDRFVRSETDLDWEQTINIAKNMDTHTTLYLGLALSQTLFLTPLPESITSSTQTERIRVLVSKTFDLLNGLLIENEGYAKYNVIHMYQMDLLDTKFKKLKHLFSTYFGISRNDCQSFPLPASLKFLYLLIKPFRVLMKYIQYGK